ncbi:hypothetical protein KGF57_004169, partial [Candida theae]
MSSDSSAVQLLPQAAGYGVLIGVGGGFAIGMIIVTNLLRRYLKEDNNSTETFSVANRSVGTLLSASAVYSSWSWADELLWTTTMVYNYGIQSSFYYMAGLVIQIVVMSMVGIHAKKKCPKAHTSLEIVELRYGKVAHILFMCLSLITNLVSCSSMILAAAGAISIIAGNLHIVAATLLTIFSVLCYSIYGGLKATFLTDFAHSLILLIVLCYFNTAVLTKVGGLDGLYDKLAAFGGSREIPGNYKNSVITGKSQGAIFFGLVLTCGNFGLSVMDSSFWQKTFSAAPRATVPAYLTAALCIMSNPWPLGAIIGGAAITMESSPSFPTYPRKMTQYEIDSGYALPYTLMATLGRSAVGGLLLILYLAVTSTISAQMISVSSITTFDIYKKYINVKAGNKSLILVSHIGCVVFTFVAAGFSLMLHYVGVNMTWFGYFTPLIICPGVIPLVMSIVWDRQTWLAAVVSPIVGITCGLAVWTTTAYKLYDAVNITTLGMQLPALYGALTALFLPGIVSVVISLIKPQKFDWTVMQRAHILVQESEDANEDASAPGEIETTARVEAAEAEAEAEAETEAKAEAEAAGTDKKRATAPPEQQIPKGESEKQDSDINTVNGLDSDQSSSNLESQPDNDALPKEIST